MRIKKFQIIDKLFNLTRSLKYSDRLSMSCGIENRVPYLDRELASFCFNLKNKYKIRYGIERFLSKNCE